MNDLTSRIQDGNELTSAEIHSAAEQLLDESVSVDAKSGFLKSLAQKGETPAEIAAFVGAFLQRAVDPVLRPGELTGPVLDVCGTGGDKLNLFNVSTSAIFILAAAGVNVVKHGNRGITSKSGGADVLEALGIRIDMQPEEFATCVRETKLGFLFAPMYHPAFKAVVPVRKRLAQEGQRTIFNILGPLLNPVRPDFQLVGVFSPELPPVFADILNRLGRKAAWAVHGTTADGQPMDEISTLGDTRIVKVSNGAISESVLKPTDLDLQPANISDLVGGDAKENAQILEQILDGSDKGPKRDLVTLNAAAGLVVAGRVPDLQAGLNLARQVIDEGAAAGRLKALREASA